MPDRHRIRPINQSSLSEIELVAQRMRQTLVEVLGEDKGGSMYTMDWLKERVGFHLDPEKSTAQIFLSESEDGHITGHCIVRIENDKNERKVGLFSTTFVEPESREQGIADALLVRGEQWMLGRGLAEAVTYTDRENDKLIQLYQKHGYEITDNYAQEKMIRLAKILTRIATPEGILSMVPVRGGELATWSIGSGPPVIFLHGGPGDTHHYMKRMAAPLFQNFQCIFFDQRGTGASDTFKRSQENFRLPLLFEDLSAVRKYYSDGPASLVGHSWGAMYALFACIQCPEQFAKAALLNMGPLDREMGESMTDHLLSALSSDEQERWNNLRIKRNKARDTGDIAAVHGADREMMHLRVKSWIFNPELRALFLNEYFQDPPPDREINKWIWESAQNWFDWDKLNSVKAKIWLCVGANDAIPVDQAKRVTHYLSDASLTIIDKCGHIPWLEHPVVFYRQLQAFLSSDNWNQAARVETSHVRP